MIFLWGICIDVTVPEIFQRAVEYDCEKSVILQPVKNLEISAKDIRFTDSVPDFVYWEVVYIKKSGISGKICDIIWHFKRGEYCYYIEVDGKKLSGRYYRIDLKK